MRAIGRLLFEPHDPLWRYCLLAFLCALIPSVILAELSELIARAMGADVTRLQAPEQQPTLVNGFGMVLLSPVIETFMLRWGLLFLMKHGASKLVTALLSAIAWGALHGLFGALWFFGTVWSFFIHSCAYLAWSKRGSRRAYAAAAVPHAMINLTAFVALKVTGH